MIELRHRRPAWDDGLPDDSLEFRDYRRWSYGGKGGSAPAPPDPAATAAAQSAANEATARVQGRMNRVDQYTPFGNINYTEMPGDRWRADVSLSPNQQRIATGNENLAIGIGDLANGQVPRLSQALASRIDTSRLPDAVALQGDIVNRSREVGQNLYDTGVARLQPQFDRDRASTLQTLADRGIGAGSGEAWTNENRDLGQRQSDALTQLSGQATQAAGAEQNRLTGLAQSLRQGDIQEQDWMRSQPIRDIGALLGTSPGGTMPQFTQAPQVGVAPTDVAGPINQAYQGQLAQWQAKNSQQNALMGGLFGLGGQALGGWASGGFALPAFLSDRRLKENIRRVGTTDGGLPVYVYNLIGDPRPQMGVMAQEVEQVDPGAVVEIGGVKHVLYGRVA